MSVKEENHATSVDNGLRQRKMKVLVMGMGRTGTTGTIVEEEIPFISPLSLIYFFQLWPVR